MSAVKKPSLVRDPADWARDNGWVSELRAGRAASRLIALASEIEDDVWPGSDESRWAIELRDVARYLAPKVKP